MWVHDLNTVRYDHKPVGMFSIPQVLCIPAGLMCIPAGMICIPMGMISNQIPWEISVCEFFYTQE